MKDLKHELRNKHLQFKNGVSAELCHLMEKMLEKNAINRINIKGVLGHPVFRLFLRSFGEPLQDCYVGLLMRTYEANTKNEWMKDRPIDALRDCGHSIDPFDLRAYPRSELLEVNRNKQIKIRNGHTQVSHQFSNRHNINTQSPQPRLSDLLKSHCSKRGSSKLSKCQIENPQKYKNDELSSFFQKTSSIKSDQPTNINPITCNPIFNQQTLKPFSSGVQNSGTELRRIYVASNVNSLTEIIKKPVRDCSIQYTYHQTPSVEKNTVIVQKVPSYQGYTTNSTDKHCLSSNVSLNQLVSESKSLLVSKSFRQQNQNCDPQRILTIPSKVNILKMQVNPKPSESYLFSSNISNKSQLKKPVLQKIDIFGQNVNNIQFRNTIIQFPTNVPQKRSSMIFVNSPQTSSNYRDNSANQIKRPCNNYLQTDLNYRDNSSSQINRPLNNVPKFLNTDDYYEQSEIKTTQEIRTVKNGQIYWTQKKVQNQPIISRQPIVFSESNYSKNINLGGSNNLKMDVPVERIKFIRPVINGVLSERNISASVGTSNTVRNIVYKIEARKFEPQQNQKFRNNQITNFQKTEPRMNNSQKVTKFQFMQPSLTKLTNNFNY